MTFMTEQDLKDAGPLADKIVEMIKNMRPPAAVAGVALALAGVTHLAKCGPKASADLFAMYFDQLDKAQR
jgi:hypothetical protein